VTRVLSRARSLQQASEVVEIDCRVVNPCSLASRASASSPFTPASVTTVA
jgi:hypothetical protein